MSGIIQGWDPTRRKRCCGSHRIAISDIGEDKSFVDDLNTERGIVSSRVALLLRSAEIKPLFSRFVLKRTFPLQLEVRGRVMCVVLRSNLFGVNESIHCSETRERVAPFGSDVSWNVLILGVGLKNV